MNLHFLGEVSVLLTTHRGFLSEWSLQLSSGGDLAALLPSSAHIL